MNTRPPSSHSVHFRMDEGVPKYMERYSASGLTATFIYLYVEILRLLTRGRK